MLYFVYQKLSATHTPYQSNRTLVTCVTIKFLPHVFCISFLSKLSCHACTPLQSKTAKILYFLATSIKKEKLSKHSLVLVLLAK